MIDHVAVLVRDIAESSAFYSQALAPTGYSELVELPDTLGGQAPTVGFCHADGSDFWIRQGTATVPPIHVAFRVSSRSAVDVFYEAAIAAGGTDNGPPGLRPEYHENYYGAFLLDPDGHNVEAVCHTSK